MSENTALILMIGVCVLTALGFAGAALVYVKTNRQHGGFVALALGVVAWSTGSHIWDVANHVIGGTGR